MIDLDKITVGNDGKIDEASLTKYVEDYKKTYPETIKTEGGNGLPPGHKPQGGGTGKLTHAEWSKLPLKDRKARMAEVES